MKLIPKHQTAFDTLKLILGATGNPATASSTYVAQNPIPTAEELIALSQREKAAREAQIQANIQAKQGFITKSGSSENAQARKFVDQVEHPEYYNKEIAKQKAQERLNAETAAKLGGITLMAAPFAGPALYSGIKGLAAAHPIATTIGFGGLGAYNLASENGLKKTQLLLDDWKKSKYKNLAGIIPFALSLTGDAMDASGVVGGIDTAMGKAANALAKYVLAPRSSWGKLFLQINPNTIRIRDSTKFLLPINDPLDLFLKSVLGPLALNINEYPELKQLAKENSEFREAWCKFPGRWQEAWKETGGPIKTLEDYIAILLGLQNKYLPIEKFPEVYAAFLRATLQGDIPYNIRGLKILEGADNATPVASTTSGIVLNPINESTRLPANLDTTSGLRVISSGVPVDKYRDFLNVNTALRAIEANGWAPTGLIGNQIPHFNEPGAKIIENGGRYYLVAGHGISSVKNPLVDFGWLGHNHVGTSPLIQKQFGISDYRNATDKSRALGMQDTFMDYYDYLATGGYKPVITNYDSSIITNQAEVDRYNDLLTVFANAIERGDDLNSVFKGFSMRELDDPALLPSINLLSLTGGLYRGGARVKGGKIVLDDPAKEYRIGLHGDNAIPEGSSYHTDGRTWIVGLDSGSKGTLALNYGQFAPLMSKHYASTVYGADTHPVGETWASLHQKLRTGKKLTPDELALFSGQPNANVASTMKATMLGLRNLAYYAQTHPELKTRIDTVMRDIASYINTHNFKKKIWAKLFTGSTMSPAATPVVMNPYSGGGRNSGISPELINDSDFAIGLLLKILQATAELGGTHVFGNVSTLAYPSKLATSRVDYSSPRHYSDLPINNSDQKYKGTELISVGTEMGKVADTLSITDIPDAVTLNRRGLLLKDFQNGNASRDASLKADPGSALTVLQIYDDPKILRRNGGKLNLKKHNI